MRARVWGAAVWIAIAGGCTAEGEDIATGFGDPTATPTTTPPIPSDGTETSTSSGSTSEGSGEDSSTVSSGDPSTSGEGSTSGSPGSTTGPSEQPEDGMYSDCASVGECVGLNACVNGSGEDPPDGYCTRTGCADPALDCDPSPGGTAPVGCVELDVNGSPASVCALTCNVGEECPAGMQCYPVPGAAICA